MLFPLLGDWAAGLQGNAATWVRNIAQATAALLAIAVTVMIAGLGFAEFPGINQFFPPGEIAAAAGDRLGFGGAATR